MARYTFTCEHFNYNDFNGDEQDVASKHTTQFRADSLETMLENFELFLRGSGFYFDGKLDIVNDFEQDDEYDEKNELSRKVFDHMVDDLVKSNQRNDEPISVTINEPNNFSINFDNMAGAHGTYTITDEIDLTPINLSIDDIYHSENTCSLCKLPVSVMKIHKCYDPKCPCGAN